MDGSHLNFTTYEFEVECPQCGSRIVRMWMQADLSASYAIINFGLPPKLNGGRRAARPRYGRSKQVRRPTEGTPGRWYEELDLEQRRFRCRCGFDRSVNYTPLKKSLLQAARDGRRRLSAGSI